MNIVDIAVATGFSTATVSRVLNNSGYVKSQTREIIEKYISEHNYTPNAIARSLSKQESSCVGVIVPDIENTFFSSMMRGVGEESEKHRMNILYFGTNEDVGLENRVLHTVMEQRLRGVIIAPVSHKDSVTLHLLEALERSGVHVVLVDRDIAGSRFDGVFVDNAQGAELAVEALLAEGHTRIATIAGPDTSLPGLERLKGFRHCLARHGVSLPQEYVEYGGFRMTPAYEATQRLLALDIPPTALFSANNMMTLGCLKYLAEHGLQPGLNISLVGFDDIELLEIVGFRLSVITRDVVELGREAMRRLVARMEKNSGQSAGTTRNVLPVRLVLRGSEKIARERL